jgi:hypothetical protein
LRKIRFAIHVARLTVHGVGGKNYPYFSDKLIEDWKVSKTIKLWCDDEKT